ncbi:MAG: PD-(D/E)XK nuclease family protein [Gallionella sp.]|nr:PD-(D/E)XK nuclease family protein [Gallionella sp.]
MRFYRSVARRILSRQGPPDLRAAVVLLQNYHAALPLAQALSSASGSPALLLPQMLTLTDWAQSVPLTVPIQPDSQRIAALYQALRERRWFPDADLWSLSRELLTLMDELTRHYVALPETAEEFARQLAEAYQARSGQAMQFEARVVHELWYAMAASDDMDVSRACQQRLAQLAQQVDSPVYVLQICDLDEAEARFLDACRERVEVTVFDLRAMVAVEPDCALLACALQQDMHSADLLSTAAGFKPDAALGGRLRLFGAHGMEQEAQAADVQVRRWLLEGRQSIAVVVQDRLVARRLRALLERARVTVQDETGWTFATLSVSTVLMRWLEAVQGDCYYQDVLDLLKSPFLFAENPAQRKRAAYQFEQLVRKHGVVAHLQDFIAVAELHAPELIQPLVRLRQAKLAMPVKSAPIADWLHALHTSLEILGVVQGWQQDAAGQQLLQLLALWRDELQSNTTLCSFAEWRRWLSQQLDLNTFRDVSVDSPVLFTHLPATRWRSFDAVLLLGCDAMHLPAPANAGQWFNDAVRATLGLPLSSRQQAQVRDDLLGLLAMNDNVLVTWQDRRDGEPNLLSPHLEMLRALHLLAFGDDLMDTELSGMLEGAKVRTQTAGVFPAQLRGKAPSCSVKDSGFSTQHPSAMPRPVVAPEMLPSRISPSGYNSLMACPYQYFARHVLRLNELDEVREELDKRDYGTWVHEVLQRFHAEIPLLNNHDQADAEQVLRRISDEVFAGALAHDYLAQAWLLRWQAQIPAYLDWQRDNEDAGWRYQAAEQPIRLEVAENLLLSGRIDRIDVRVDDATMSAVLDYKTQAVNVLKNKLKEPGEDVQLACYAQAAGAGVAAFVSLEDDKVLAVAPPQDIGELAQLNLERLQTVFAQMRDGTGLPAHGAEKVCSYCEMKGLCRRGEWQDGELSSLPLQGEG